MSRALRPIGIPELIVQILLDRFGQVEQTPGVLVGPGKAGEVRQHAFLRFFALANTRRDEVTYEGFSLGEQL